MAVQLYPLRTSVIATGGVAVTVSAGSIVGGFIANPEYAVDQGLLSAEALYVDLVSSAALAETSTTFVLQPGSTYELPADFDGNVSVNAATTGHRFAGIIYQTPAAYVASEGIFPPSGPTVLLSTLLSYLYQQYQDDDDLQAFVDGYNTLTQQYITWFATVGLPIYTGLTGQLLDWVAAGLYGITRPALPSGINQNIGPYNTWAYNTIPFNTLQIIGPDDYYLTNDDIFKRIITWHFWKGDGKIFDVRWLKRRVMRFLTGENGTAGYTDQTYQVSVTFGAGNQININLQSTRRYASGGALYGFGLYNNFMYNQFDTTSVSIPISPLVPVFKAAVDAGVLELPFQFEYVVNVN